METKQNFAKRRATFFAYPIFRNFLVIRVQKSWFILDYFFKGTSGYKLCGRFEYFGSYFGNRGMIWARMGITCGLAEWKARKGGGIF
jgi:hypothetical protein